LVEYHHLLVVVPQVERAAACVVVPAVSTAEVELEIEDTPDIAVVVARNRLGAAVVAWAASVAPVAAVTG